MFRPSKRARPGFTLVELLVVIAIIGILIALLLPAVQAAREAARRSQCLNNQKQLALALQNYHDGQKVLPPGGIWLATGAPSPDGRNPNWGATWVTMLLPYFEQVQLYNQYNFGRPARHAQNQPATSQKIAALVCPSSENLTQPLTQSGGIFAKGNYGANFASDDAFSIGDWDNPLLSGVISAVAARGRTLDEIKDGTSNTLVTSEVLGMDVQDDGRGAWAHVCGPVVSANSSIYCAQSGANCTYTGVVTFIYTPNRSLPGLERDQPAHCGGDANFRYCDDNTGAGAGIGARSRHPGGVNFALADGSARFASETISPRIWRDLFTPHGREASLEF
jgi:prepilin-type N-terminal cleavage/methylation domain-containing protein/prepilin-type processing-associated H-X9-DG protein